jgi:Tol biopolymer transport system component
MTVSDALRIAGSNRSARSIAMKLLLLLVLIASPALGQTTQRVSTSGNSVNNSSAEAAISADGRFVAFVSSGTNLVANDTNMHSDVFVRDLQSGTTDRVSIATDGTQGNGDSLVPAISADGRYVAFASAATNLVAGDTNGVYDVFVRDRQLGTTERVSLSPSGSQLTLDSGYGTGFGFDEPLGVSISADGRFVAFGSQTLEVYVRDRQNATTDDVTEMSFGSPYHPSISADGRYVAFHAAGATHFQVYVKDRQTSTFELISVATNNLDGNGDSSFPSISADGRYVTFVSTATDLVAGDTNGFWDIFLRDRLNGTTELVSVSTNGTQGNAGVLLGYTAPDRPISGDGRYVVFATEATNLDASGVAGAFLRDRQSGTTVRLVFEANGAPGTGYDLSISADARFVAFTSIDSHLVGVDVNGFPDVFALDRQTNSLQFASVGIPNQANSFSDQPAISADGRCVVFRSNASHLVPQDTNTWYDLFVYDRPSGNLEWVSPKPNGTAANGPSEYPVISSDGRYVAFQSYASDLVAGDTNNTGDIFLRDRTLLTTTRVSLTSSGTQSFGPSYTCAISGDGRYVAFDNDGNDLVPNDTNNARDIFVRDVIGATTERVSVASDGTQANNYSQTPAISADGRFVVFGSYSTNLVAGVWL